MKKVKVLYFVDRILRGGIQSFVYDYIKHFDRNRVQVDLLLLDDGNHYELEDTFKELGVKIYKLEGVWLNSPKNYLKYIKKLSAFYKKHHDYQAVHLHSGSKNFPVLMWAKRYKIPVRIAHSHNTRFQMTNKLYILFGDILKMPLRHYATHYFACSKMAGRWLFGEKLTAQGKVRVINNAIDLDLFHYDTEKRNSLRRELGVVDKFVVGNVGRIVHQKNQDFLIDVFYEFNKSKPDSVLLIVGEGVLEGELKEKVKELNLVDSVKFLGFREDRNDILLAMDLFILTSHFEGLGIVLVEAQAAGLRCITSDVVPNEVFITDRVSPISLKKSAEYWSGQILKYRKEDFELKDTSEEIKKAGYDIKTSAKELEEFYINISSS